jgi:hypothetical protein
MAIRITPAGSVPAVDLKYIHFDKFNMSISRRSPAKVALTAEVVLYGLDPNGKKVFDSRTRTLTINDLDAFITGLDPSQQASAAEGVGMLSAGLGKLAEKYFGWTFEAVE